MLCFLNQIYYYSMKQPFSCPREHEWIPSQVLSTSLINTFECHVLCTDGKISVRINLLFCLYFPPSSQSDQIVNKIILIMLSSRVRMDSEASVSNCRLPQSEKYIASQSNSHSIVLTRLSGLYHISITFKKYIYVEVPGIESASSQLQSDILTTLGGVNYQVQSNPTFPS